MNISFSTPVVNIKGETGYGYAGRNIVNSLNTLGHFVPLQLNFSQPNLFKLHRGQYQISYTPWESTVVPKRWLDNMKHCDEVWTTSDWCANVFEDNGFKDVKVFPHGLDPMWTPRKRQQKETLKFLHIGEPAPRKGGQMVVDAFSHLFGNKPGYSLTIKCFNQNSTRIYNNYIHRNIIGLPNELYNNIHINNKVLNDEELVRLYHDHDVLVYPSYGEGFGLIPLQALGTGMPTICTYDWAQYKDYIGPLKLKSELIDSPWEYMHEGKVLEPSYQHLLEVMRDVDLNFKAYSAYYYTQSTKIHEEYNWLRLTNNAFSHIFKKFS
jgi:glycosyltransferase involved in cell wall biosynthesis